MLTLNKILKENYEFILSDKSLIGRHKLEKVGSLDEQYEFILSDAPIDLYEVSLEFDSHTFYCSSSNNIAFYNEWKQRSKMFNSEEAKYEESSAGRCYAYFTNYDDAYNFAKYMGCERWVHCNPVIISFNNKIMKKFNDPYHNNGSMEESKNSLVQEAITKNPKPPTIGIKVEGNDLNDIKKYIIMDSNNIGNNEDLIVLVGNLVEKLKIAIERDRRTIQLTLKELEYINSVLAKFSAQGGDALTHKLNTQNPSEQKYAEA